MKQLFWLLVLMAAWAPYLTVMYYTSGGQETELHRSISQGRLSDRRKQRLVWPLCWLLFDQANRWAVTAIGLIGLLVLRLAT